VIRALVATAATIAAFVLISSPAGARTVECQHPLRTGMEAYKLKNVSSATACKLVIALSKWKTQWYVCKGAGSDSAGTPVIKVHHFEGWTLSVPKYSALLMSRGDSSFQVEGTDFPINCS
jgi:hypothetical protein